MNRVFVIAEAGVNHNGSVSEALRLVDVAADCGADAVKFQTFNAEKLASRNAPKADYQLRTTDSSELQVDMLRKLELSKDAHHALLNRCHERGIEFMSTGFDLDSLKFLAEEIGIRRIKIPSGEITNGPLLLQAARYRKPLILSTGMSTLQEIGDALAVLAFGYTHSSGTPSDAGFREAYESTNGRRVLADQVKDRLLQGILSGRYPPHSRIVETRVARELASLPHGWHERDQLRAAGKPWRPEFVESSELKDFVAASFASAGRADELAKHVGAASA